LSQPVKAEGKRRYDASRRRAAALETRRAVLDAARALFLERGYARTTISAIARAAGVSVETIYLAVGPKAAVVRYLVETALSGADEPIPAEERDWVHRFRTEPDPRLKIRLHAAPAITEMYRRLAPLWAVLLEAAPGDPELQSLIDELNQRRTGHMRLMAEHLAAGGLRPGLSIEMATDVLWATNSAEFFLLLVRGRGWDPDLFQHWLAEAWIELLLPPVTEDAAASAL
jgi:AcrR family transcriptional regulator